MLFRKKEEGSITVEASLIMPVFLVFLIALITIIKIFLVQMTLTDTVSEATKQISTHMYPVDLLYEKFNETETGGKVNDAIDHIENSRDKIIKTEDFVEEYSYLFPEEIKSILTIREETENQASETYNMVLNKAFQPIVDYYAKESILNVDQLYVTKVTFPHLRQRDNPYFGIEVRYDLPLNIPFIDQVITLKEKSYERVWVGDSISSPSIEETPDSATDSNNPLDQYIGNEDHDTVDSSIGEIIEDLLNDNESDIDSEEPLYIDSINSPVQRGKTVRIIAKGPPNKSARVNLYYHSGFEKGKDCRFNSRGWLQCTLKIGGHANEGNYQAEVKVDNRTVKGYFEVLSKENMEKYR